MKQIEKFAKWMQDSDHHAYQAKEGKEADDQKDEEKPPLKAAACCFLIHSGFAGKEFRSAITSMVDTSMMTMLASRSQTSS